jgi:hypothetical protein
MTVIEIPDDLAMALKAKAAAEGLTLEAWFKKLAEDAPASPPKTRPPAFRLLGEYGTAPSAEEADADRRDMFQGFGLDF